jgi:hypothetical protein
MTARMNVTMPDELAELVRTELPGLNVSAVLQRELAKLVRCPHDALACSCCGATVQQRALVDAQLSAFYQDVIWQLQTPVGRCETAEGAARVVQSVARAWEVSAVDVTPLPRPTRSQRARVHADLVKEAEAATAAQFESGAKPRRRARTA